MNRNWGQNSIRSSASASETRVQMLYIKQRMCGAVTAMQKNVYKYTSTTTVYERLNLHFISGCTYLELSCACAQDLSLHDIPRKNNGRPLESEKSSFSLTISQAL